jgi:Poxvirus A32 protein
MEIVNLGEYLIEDECPSINLNFLAPKWPFRMLIIGPSGCGKSNLLMNLILKYIYFHKLFLYSKHLEQPLYEQFMNATEGHNNFIFDNDVEEIIDIDALDADEQNLICFDDFLTEKNQDIFTNFFIRGRHKNCSVIYLTQSYFSTPKDLRLNCNVFVLFNVRSKRELLEIQKEHATNISKDNFCKLYSEATTEPYSFFVIDKHSTFLPLMYRKNFDELCQLIF